MRVSEQEMDRITQGGDHVKGGRTLDADVKGVAHIDGGEILRLADRELKLGIQEVYRKKFQELQMGVNEENAHDRIMQTLALGYAHRMASEEVLINLSMRTASNYTMFMSNLERMRAQEEALLREVAPEPDVEQFNKYRSNK